jgi:hypothetical protein
VVRVAPAVSLSEPVASAKLSTLRGRSLSWRRPRITFSGTVSPLGMGRRVALQVFYQATGERWHTVAIGVVGADGTYSITHGFRVSGPMVARTVVHTARNNAAGVSRSVSYSVPQPENPQLTIQVSPNPSAYGQPITIAGVASGPAGQSVTLLGRSHGGVPAVLDKATTDEHGGYSFTQAPLEDTSYLVTDATTKSTPAFTAVEAPLVPDAEPDTAQVGQQLTFTGTLGPAPVGQLVYLERGYPSGLGFHVVSEAIGSISGYSLTYTFNTVGTRVMRIKVPGGVDHATAVTEPFPVTVSALP